MSIVRIVIFIEQFTTQLIGLCISDGGFLILDDHSESIWNFFQKMCRQSIHRKPDVTTFVILQHSLICQPFKHEWKICFRKISDCYFIFFYFHVILPANCDLLLNFVFKLYHKTCEQFYRLYHKTCEQFYRNFGLYEKSPNSFLPGLPRSIINQLCFHNFLCLRLASVHLPHPFHLVFSFQLLGHAVLLCQ